MTNSLFVTGCRGFIGRHLMLALEGSRYENIYCLSRSCPAATESVTSSKSRWIKATLRQTEIYARDLAASDAVIHLAAATGKAKPEDYFDVNYGGTQLLLEQCKRQGVTKFLFVSSIAVNFPDKSYYHYARSKEEAERLVRASGLNYTIIRPTIVLGAESPIWKHLSQLAKGPAVLLFGDGRAKIQPIYVDDLVDMILSLVNQGSFRNETLELGGPESIAIEDFLQRIHERHRGKTAPVVHLPLRPLFTVLSFAERFATSFLPFNRGQLATFMSDGTADDNPLTGRAHPTMRNIDAMIELLIAKP